MIFLTEPNAKWKEINEIVRLAQQAALVKIQPGVPAKEVDAAARDYITERGYGDNFGHGLGHGIGMGGGPRLSRNSTDISNPVWSAQWSRASICPDSAACDRGYVLVTKDGYERLTKLPIARFS